MHRMHRPQDALCTGVHRCAQTFFSPKIPKMFKNPKNFLTLFSSAACHHQIGLLRPFLCTSQSGEFRTGLKSYETACLPTQHVGQSSYAHRTCVHSIFSAQNIPNIFLNRLSLATCHHQIGLLRPFLSTSQSDKFRTGITNFKTLC